MNVHHDGFKDLLKHFVENAANGTTVGAAS